MCKSAAQGGQRCAAHTRTKYERALKTADPDAIRGAAVPYASTREGREHFVQEADIHAAAGRFESAATATGYVTSGDALRAANKESATRVTEALADANDDEDEKGQCRTDDCDGDPDDGDSYDGYCGNCADTAYANEYDEDDHGPVLARYNFEDTADTAAATRNKQGNGTFLVKHDIDLDTYVIVKAPEAPQATPAPVAEAPLTLAERIRRSAVTNTLTLDPATTKHAQALTLDDIDRTCAAGEGVTEIDDITAHAIISRYATEETPELLTLLTTGRGDTNEMQDELHDLRTSPAWYAMNPTEKLRLNAVGTWVTNHNSRRGA